MQDDGPILFDIPDGRPEGEDFLADLGHSVLVCHGPDHDAPCPILAGHDCELLDAAHGIVFELDLDKEEHRQILAKYREVAREGAPIGVVVPPEQRERHAGILQGLRVWTHIPSAGDLDALAAEVEAEDL